MFVFHFSYAYLLGEVAFHILEIMYSVFTGHVAELFSLAENHYRKIGIPNLSAVQDVSTFWHVNCQSKKNTNVLLRSPIFHNLGQCEQMKKKYTDSPVKGDWFANWWWHFDPCLCSFKIYFKVHHHLQFSTHNKYCVCCNYVNMNTFFGYNFHQMGASFELVVKSYDSPAMTAQTHV